MKTIGLIGGLSWESSIVYYRLINELVRQRLGGVHSCKSLMYTVDFAAVEQLQARDDWQGVADILVRAGLSLEHGGADCLVICSNTMHKLAEDITSQVTIPLLHIADCTASHIRSLGLKRVGLLGTRFTMEQDFYRGRLAANYGIEVLVPGPAAREAIHAIIFGELVVGKLLDESRQKCRDVINELVQRGAEGIILGCTELPLLVRGPDSPVPLFDTMQFHAQAAVDFALRP
jgi:aspartate racemase